MARRKLRSANRAKAQQRVARVQAKTANQRKDFIHKVTTELVRNYEGVCIEDLSVQGLAKTKLAKSVLDAGLGEFRRQLGYKTIWNRRHLAVIDRGYPSSQTCHACGAVNAALRLADRSWRCGCCGWLHDRDLQCRPEYSLGGLATNTPRRGAREEPKCSRTRRKTSAVGSSRG